MPRRETYVPKHRAPAPERTPTPGASRLRSTLFLSGAAVAATGLAVSSGLLAQQDAEGDDAHAALRAAPQIDTDREPDADVAERLAERERAVSRSDRRTSAKDEKKKATRTKASERKAAGRDRLADDDPRDIARTLLPRYGFSQDQFGCLDALYVSESNWDPHADNPTSSAYGIPQALTETHELPADYMTNPATQIRWGLGYIRSSYGTPCAAWEFKQANNWY